MELNTIQKNLLEKIAGLETIPHGAVNIRVDGKLAYRNNSANIEIETKKDKQGIDIYIKKGTKNERVDIPVLLTQTGLKDLVYNDFYIAEDTDVTIVAGCGIHNEGSNNSEHDGIHTFHVAKGGKAKYIEKHFAEGKSQAKKILNPTTIIDIEDNGYLEMETSQIGGVDDTERKMIARLGKNATLIVNEKILTDGEQRAITDFELYLNGERSSCHVVSRSVAKDKSKQTYISDINGNNLCTGHTECDAIIMDRGLVSAVPKIHANHVDATLIHEAAIGKIAGEQLIKLMTLGLTEKQAEEQIIAGFLK